MLHDLKLKIQQYLSREWTGFLWLLIPISLLPLNLISAFLTGGGHAPYFMYLPFVILYGPSLVTYKVINWNEFWPILWVPLLSTSYTQSYCDCRHQLAAGDYCRPYWGSMELVGSPFSSGRTDSSPYMSV